MTRVPSGSDATQTQSNHPSLHFKPTRRCEAHELINPPDWLILMIQRDQQSPFRNMLIDSIITNKEIEVAAAWAFREQEARVMGLLACFFYRRLSNLK